MHTCRERQIVACHTHHLRKLIRAKPDQPDGLLRPCINTLHCSPSTFVTSMGQVKPLASTCFFPQHLPDDMQSYTPTLLLWPWFVLMHKRKEALAIFTLLGIGGVSAQLNIIKTSQFYIIAHLLMFSSSNIGSCSPCVCECSDL